MKKLALLVAALMTTATFSTAQMQVGVSPELDLPIGTFADAAGLGFGASLRGEYMLNEAMTVGVNAGFLTFAEEADVTQTVIPIHGLFKYQLGSLVPGLYAVAEAGLNMMSSEVESTFMGTTTTVEADNNEIGVGVGAGYIMPLGEKLDLDASLRLEMLDIGNAGDSMMLGVRVGVNYKL